MEIERRRAAILLGVMQGECVRVSPPLVGDAGQMEALVAALEYIVDDPAVVAA